MAWHRADALLTRSTETPSKVRILPNEKDPRFMETPNKRNQLYTGRRWLWKKIYQQGWYWSFICSNQRQITIKNRLGRIQVRRNWPRLELYQTRSHTTDERIRWTSTETIQTLITNQTLLWTDQIQTARIWTENTVHNSGHITRTNSNAKELHSTSLWKVFLQWTRCWCNTTTFPEWIKH